MNDVCDVNDMFLCTEAEEDNNRHRDGRGHVTDKTE
jgi:hypothetical protein